MRKSILATLAASLSISFAADRVTLTGKVTDSSGRPIEDATVMIYHAGVKEGYSTFCPSCYSDCGKRAATDASGLFTIPQLDPDLQFELLVVHNGYKPKFIGKVEPSLGPAETAAMVLRAPAHLPNRVVVLGRVVDSNGRPLPDAVVVRRGVVTILEGRGPVTSLYNAQLGLEFAAVTNAEGEFELDFSRETAKVLLDVEARGMATEAIVIPTGTERKIISLSDGAVIRGRLMDHGQPMAGAEVGLYPRKGGVGEDLSILGAPYREIRIGTQEDGSFVIPHVPAPVDWYIYGKMESIAALGATPPVECATKRDKDEVDMGDIQIQPGHHLRGKITLSDGAPMPDGMRMTILATRSFDSRNVTIGRDGSFEFSGLATGDYEIYTNVRGYQLPWGNLLKTVSRDIDDLAIVLNPTTRN